MTKELDFSGDETPEDVVDNLIYGSIYAQVELYGMSWEEVKRLFPNNYEAARAAYESEMREAEINQ